MIQDVWTIIWKEWKEILGQWGRTRTSAIRLLFLFGFMGIFFPLQVGREWMTSPITLALWLWLPLFMVMAVIADSFAGERERHTLETLLATRLSDESILAGKVGAAVGYGVGFTLVILALGTVVVLAFGSGSGPDVATAAGPTLSPWLVGLGGFGLALLSAGLGSGAGILVSLRAPSVRQAQQVLSISTMVLLFLPIFGSKALPASWRVALANAVSDASLVDIVLGVLVALLVVDVILLVLARARFRRARLILN